jgi:2-polyprenyl-6-methoxyphenol hydroxylase-like FAD-dependent oxidoreductase
LVLTLLLAKAGIKVTLLDAASTLDDRPRAAHYAPSAIRVLRKAGVLDDVRRDGFIPRDIAWRKIDGTPIVTFKDASQPNIPDALTILPLHMLGNVLLSHAEKDSNVTIYWNHKVVDVGSDNNFAWAKTRSDDGAEKTWEADYLCGCDGGTSQVRRSLFGEKNFPGKTWDAQIVATNLGLSPRCRGRPLAYLFQVYYPFEKFGYDDANFIIHPTDYYMAAKITTDGLWRVSYGEDTKLTPEEVKAHQPAKYERMLPGNPKPGDYKLLNVGPYRIHQRCANNFRVGKICLAADAAHLCNPFGGLGLTGGLVDVGGLAECLEGIATGRADDSILNKYDKVRRELWHSVINPISSSNFLRVSATDPETAAEKDEFLAMVKTAGHDKCLRKQLDDVCVHHDLLQSAAAYTVRAHGIFAMISRSTITL